MKRFVVANPHSRLRAAAVAFLLLGGVSLGGPIEESLKSVVLIKTPQGLGTGFVVHDQSLIATNLHVIAGAKEAIAVFSTGEKIAVDGFLVASPEHDLAILHLADPSPAEPLSLSDDRVDLGTDVYAIGSPQGLAGSVSKGVVSAYRRWADLAPLLRDSLDDFGYEDNSQWVQTDAAINGGNSGGPLVLASGEVIAINTLGSSAAAGQNINFAVDVSHLQRFVERLPKKIKALASIPSSDRMAAGEGQESVASAEKTFRYWTQVSKVFGSFTADHQRVRIDMGAFRLIPRKQGEKNGPKAKAGLDDERFGKTRTARMHRIVRLATEARIPYNEAVQMDYPTLKEKAELAKVQKSAEIAARVRQRGLDPWIAQEEYLREAKTAQERLTKKADESMSRLVQLAAKAAVELDAIPTDGVNPGLVSFVVDLSTAFRQVATDASQARHWSKVSAIGGSTDDEMHATREMGHSLSNLYELRDVVGGEVRTRLSNIYNHQFGPVVYLSAAQQKLFEGEDVEIK
jgi:S1-C subfamily serine protease